MDLKTRNCLMCKKPFQPAVKNHVRCGSVKKGTGCATIHNIEKRKARYEKKAKEKLGITKTCEQCKKEFVAEHGKIEICSDKCRSIRKAERNKLDREVVCVKPKLIPRDHLCDYENEIYSEGVIMKCDCGSEESKVIDSRPRTMSYGDVVWRRRTCLGCGGRFTTFEIRNEGFEVAERVEKKQKRAKELLKELLENFE